MRAREQAGRHQWRVIVIVLREAVNSWFRPFRDNDIANLSALTASARTASQAAHWQRRQRSTVLLITHICNTVLYWAVR
jgi:hypothetical protein